MKLRDVDPFIGTEPTAIGQPEGLAATWWWPKPQIGNTHPGAAFPLGMVSACAYSGAYPTGYGSYGLSTEGVPPTIVPGRMASGITHFQQTGTGAIRKYYNYARVTPMLGPLDELGTQWEVTDEEASPGVYACTLSSGIRCEVTVGERSAVHRFTFPRHRNARIVIDLSLGGLDIPYGATIPLRAHLESVAPGFAEGEVVMEGTPLALSMEADAPGWRQLLWYDRRLMPGGKRLDFDAIRPTTLRPFGLMWAGPTTEGQQVEVRIGFSLRGTAKAARNLRADSPEGSGFDERRRRTERRWHEHLDAIRLPKADEHTPSKDQRTVFGTALYHSLIKPSLAYGESPFWPAEGPFVFDLCTMWDIYRTQLPLLATLTPERAVELANALITICEEEGNFPIGYRMAKGSDRFSRQASALAHTFLADLCLAGVEGIDWDWALVHMLQDLRRTYGEDFLTHGRAEPITHTLDLAFGYWCTAQVARVVGDHAVVAECLQMAGRWRNAFDEGTGLLRDSVFYEGTKWNYSFRITHDMGGRIELAGGESRFIGLLDTFFGYGADAVVQPGVSPGVPEMETGYALGRFEGLNNEPDMDAPWAYTYAGRPDRTTEVVHGVVTQMFTAGPGGLPGNDDSGGLSSWYVWAVLGLMPAAGQNVVLLNAPAVPEAKVRVGEDAELQIITTGFDAVAPGAVRYVQAVRWRGKGRDAAWLPASELREGGVLEVDLGPEPSAWGTHDRPPSHPAPAPTTPVAVSS